MLCNSCGHSNPAEALFCIQCGNRLPEEFSTKKHRVDLIPPSPVISPNANYTSADHCSQCGNDISSGASFCPACGARADGHSSYPPLETRPPYETPEEVEFPQQQRGPIDVPTREAPDQPTTSHRASNSRWWLLGIIGLTGAVIGIWWFTREPLPPTEPPVTTESIVEDLPIELPASENESDAAIKPDGSTIDPQGLLEWEEAKRQFDAAFTTYTTLITTGGSGNVEDALHAYKRTLDELKAVEKKWGITPKQKSQPGTSDIPGIENIQ